MEDEVKQLKILTSKIKADINGKESNVAIPIFRNLICDEFKKGTRYIRIDTKPDLRDYVLEQILFCFQDLYKVEKIKTELKTLTDRDGREYPSMCLLIDLRIKKKFWFRMDEQNKKLKDYLLECEHAHSR